MSSTIQVQHLHFVLLPLMSPGHIIPMFDMAKLIANHGPSVTIVVTPVGSRRFSPTIARAVASGLSIRLHLVRFPLEAGLPEGCESVDDLPSPSYRFMRNFSVAINMLQQQVEQLLSELRPRPSCVICDRNFSWMEETARNHGIPRITFDGTSCFTQLSTHNLHISKLHEQVSDPDQSFALPGLPDTVEVTKAQLPGVFNPGAMNVQDFRARVRDAELSAYGVVLNTFEELEQSYVNEFKKVMKGKVWCVGPMSLSYKEQQDRAQRGNMAAIDEKKCMEWLDSQQPSSVVYACLGSIICLSPPQITELGLGLESSNRPFIWVIRAGSGRDEKMKEWIVKSGFEARTKGRGLVIHGWAPQLLILSHPAVGAFLTHCGWNSTLEGVSSGVPMITWPLFAEQFFNEKVIVQLLKIGESVGAKAVVHLGEEEKFGVSVSRDDIKKAIERVMTTSTEKGEERIRERIQRLKEIANRALEKGGSSYMNMKMLIEDIAAVAVT